MASAASALVSGTPDVTGIINIAEGTVAIASISGASAAANTTATANVNLSGGTLTMGGNITRTGGAGTSAFNLNLSGGTLDMGGNTIGATGSNVTFNWTNGTLKNVSGLNGTAGITVDTSNQSNPVYLDGTNTFTSKITIKDSILQLQSTTALAANSQIGFDGTLGVLKLESGVTLDVSSNLSSGNAQLDTNGNDVIFNSPVVGLTSFTKLGSGKLTLSSSSGSLAPIVTILYGPLELGNGDNQIPSGGFLNGTTSLTLDGSGSSPELIANGVSVDLDAVVNLLNSGATISGTKGTSNYSFNFLKDIIAQDDSSATISATDMITGSNSLFNVGSGAILTISGSFIDGVTATQITKNGIGTLEFTGTTASTYSGATTVNAGTLAFSQGTLTGSSTAITVNNGANLTAVDLDANVSITVATSGKADISGTNLNVKDIVTQNSTLDDFIFSGTDGKITAQSLSGSGSVTFASDSLEVDNLSGAGSIVFSSGTSTIAAGSGSFSGTITGAQSFVKQGSGKLTISGTNALTGIVTLDGGVLSISDFDSLSAASTAENLVLQGGKLEYTGSAATMARGFTVGDGISGFNASGTGALTISGNMDFADTSASNRTLSLGGTSEIAVENIYNPNKIDTADVDNLFTKLVKQETNKWIVLGAGAGFVDEAQTEIDIQNGELGFAMGALGSKSTITLGGTGGATATLGWFNDGATTNTDDVSARINLKNNASAAFDIPTGNTVTFGTALSGGTGTSVTKSGGGTLNLDKTNPFSGGFTISGGIVKAGAVGSMGSGNITVNSNSTLVVGAAITNTLTINSGGIITIDTDNNPDQSIRDATIMSGGTLVPGGDVIGTLTVRNLTLKGGSIVNWQISDASGAANNDYSLAGSGYDTFILNSLVLTDISLSKRVIHVKNTTSNGGIASNFDKTAVQTFQFAKLTTALQSQVNVTDLFEIDATEFEYINGLQTDQLVWYMTLSADREYLYVVAVPEPSTYGLGLGALALAFAAVRRRKQKKNPAAV
ncbi:MAG: autotransporter-associated beta strand repeat-containing protein [Opitutales bacterium]|nr:autotransporter-associated beta strand repeat-containing protein [Opitutales bacterium]